MDLSAALSRGGGRNMTFQEFMGTSGGNGARDEVPEKEEVRPPLYELGQGVVGGGLERAPERPAQPAPAPVPAPAPAPVMQTFTAAPQPPPKRTISFQFVDPADGERVVFHSFDSGAYYTVGGVARPVFRNAFFGRDEEGIYIELTDINRLVPLPQKVAPDAVRRLKLLFEASNVTHNLHEKPKAPPLPPPESVPVPVPLPESPAPPVPDPVPVPLVEEQIIKAVRVEEEAKKRAEEAKKETTKEEKEEGTKARSKALEKARKFEEMYWNGATVGGSDRGSSTTPPVHHGTKGGKTGGKFGRKGHAPGPGTSPTQQTQGSKTKVKRVGDER